MEKINVIVKFGSKIEDVIHNDVLRDKRPMSVEDENNNLIFYLPDAIVPSDFAGNNFNQEDCKPIIKLALIKDNAFKKAVKKYISDSVKGKENEKKTIEELETLIPEQLFDVVEITVAENYVEPK